jgi:hypothetical protein
MRGRAIVVAGLWACAPEPAVPTGTTPGNPQPSVNACAVQQAGGTGPVLDPNGPYYHQMAIANSADGLAISNEHRVLDHASVPDGVRRADGSVLAYYVNGAEGPVWIARIQGDSAVPIGPLTLNGVSPVAGVVDPDAMLLPGDTVRLTYFAGFGPPSSTTPKAMCIAQSADGLHFTVLGAAFSYPATELLTDPSLARLPDGSWRMAISWGPRTIMAQSADGRTFTRYDTLDYGGVPEIGVTAAGALRLYVCKAGIVAYTSSDGGHAWTFEATVVPPGTLGANILCDPSWVPGADLFIFKTAN